MTPSSSQQGAREEPPLDKLAALYSLADKIARAGALNRHSRSIELSAHAADKAEAFFGDDTLVVAELRIRESEAYVGLSESADGAEQEALFRRSWSALLSVIALLQRRIAADTLLPGTVRKEESEYYAHVQAASCAAQNKPALLPPMLEFVSGAIGYCVFLDALYRSLHFMLTSFQPRWPDAQRKIVHSFVRLFTSLILTWSNLLAVSRQ